jgi:hypothetical protein
MNVGDYFTSVCFNFLAYFNSFLFPDPNNLKIVAVLYHGCVYSSSNAYCAELKCNVGFFKNIDFLLNMKHDIHAESIFTFYLIVVTN